MTERDSKNSFSVRSQTKVERLIEEYDLEGIGEELEQRWTEKGEERDSLRTLANVFNMRILEQAMRSVGMNPIEGEVENNYKLLTDENASRGVETEVRNRLEQEGIDIEALCKDFLTYQAIRTYLKDIREASLDLNTENRIERAQSSFGRLIGRTTAVVEQKLEQLKTANELTLGTFSVHTTVTIYCEDCKMQSNVNELLRTGGCKCDPNSK
ncbi:rod-determining factor RdfA [Haladaptatus pallidirubidus]|nr:rod-determining factor RdfA [Haladaptatus pallidirubidus]